MFSIHFISMKISVAAAKKHSREREKEKKASGRRKKNQIIYLFRGEKTI